MARYIDAVNGATSISKKLNIHISDLVDAFAEIPTANVEEVKHGEWSLKHIGAGHSWECSKCAFQLCTMPRTNYCPYCGAKMDRK